MPKANRSKETKIKGEINEIKKQKLKRKKNQ